MRFGNLDAHHTEVEELLQQRARNLCVLIHLAGERTNFPVRELVDAVPQQPLVLRQSGQRPANQVCGRGGHSA